MASHETISPIRESQEATEVELAALEQLTANHAEFLKLQLIAMGTVAVVSAIQGPERPKTP